MQQRTLRRKLQKKAKHKPYRKCRRCGGRMECELIRMHADESTGSRWALFKVCNRCVLRVELFWSGGGTGRHIPSRPQG